MDIPNPEKYLTRSKSKVENEYQEAVMHAAKVVGQKYFVFHKRVESAFGEVPMERVAAFLNGWSAEAEKEENPPLAFNTLFKRYRNNKLRS